MDASGKRTGTTSAGKQHQVDLPVPAGDEQASTAWHELVRQFEFFDSRARKYQRLHYTLRATVLLVGAAIPIVALTLEARGWVAALGAVVVVGEGLAQLTQAQDHWIRYRRTAESLRAEALAFTTATGPYRRPGQPTRLDQLAERLNRIFEEEGADWARTAHSDPPSDEAA